MLERFRYTYGVIRGRALQANFAAPGEIWQKQTSSETAGFGDSALELLAFGENLARNLPSRGRRLAEAFLARVELENLKVLCRGVVRGRAVEEVSSLLISAPGRRATLQERLRGAESPEDLARRLPPSRFRQALAGILPESGELGLFRLETALESAYWEEVRERLRALPLPDRRGAVSLISRRADLIRLQIVARGRNLELDPREIVRSLPSVGTILSPARVRRALASEDPERALRALLPFPDLESPWSREGETILLRRLRRCLLRALRAPPFTLAPVLAVLLLKELEIRDRRAVVSGKRLGIDREEISLSLSLRGD